MKYCGLCGAPHEEGAKFCGECGSPIGDSSASSIRENTADTTQNIQTDTEAKNESAADPAPYKGSQYIQPGFSDRANDPTIAQMRKLTVNVPLRIGVFFSLVAFLGMLAIWYFGEGGFTIKGLIIPLKIGVIPFLLSIPFHIAARLDKEWEGTVSKSKTKVEYHPKADDECERNPRKTEKYIVKVKLGKLRSKKLVFHDYQTLNYYRPGNRVKHHRNNKFPEKFDKNQDEELRCIHCFTANDKGRRLCKACNVALMK